MKKLGLIQEDTPNQDWWRSLRAGNRPTLPQCGFCSFMNCVLVTLNVNSDYVDDDADEELRMMMFNVNNPNFYTLQFLRKRLNFVIYICCKIYDLQYFHLVDEYGYSMNASFHEMTRVTQSNEQQNSCNEVS